MAKMKKRRREVWNSNINPGPTPETVAKQKIYVIGTLRRQGIISLEQEAAAEQIWRMWEAIGRGLFSHASDPSTPNGGQTRNGLKGLEAMTPREYEKIWSPIYRPWSLKQGYVIVAPGLRRMQLVHEITIKDVWPEQLDERYGMVPGTATHHLVAALDSYNRHAGRY